MTPEIENSIPIDNFAEKVALRSNIDTELVKEYLKKLFEVIGNELLENDKVLIYQFGVFKRKWVAQRMGVDPNSGNKITIPDHYRVSFTVAKFLDERVNQNPFISDETFEEPANLNESEIDEIVEEKIEIEKEISANKEVLPEVLPIEDDSDFFIPDNKPVLDDEYSKLTNRKNKKEKYFFSKIKYLLIFLFLIILLLGSTFLVHNYNERQRINLVVTLLNNIVDPVTYKIDYALLKKFYQQKRSLEDRHVIHRHLIKRGDTIYDLSIKYWNNKNLWPDMYVMNLNKITDPDMLKYGYYLNIYDKLAENTKDLSWSQRNELVERYLLSYKLYKALGYQDIENKNYQQGYYRLNGSVWILYTAAGYDQKLIKKYSDIMSKHDKVILTKYINKFGYR